MYSQSRRPSEIIAMQKQVIEEQEGIIAILKGALAAAGGQEPSSDHHPWMDGLTRQEQALLGALFRCYPRPIDRYELLEHLPGYDHAEDRQAQIVTVKVHHLRKKLGEDTVENVRGFGYRLGARQYEAMRGRETAPQPTVTLTREPRSWTAPKTLSTTWTACAALAA